MCFLAGVLVRAFPKPRKHALPMPSFDSSYRKCWLSWTKLHRKLRLLEIVHFLVQEETLFQWEKGGEGLDLSLFF